MGNEIVTENTNIEPQPEGDISMLQAIALFKRPDGTYEIETVRGPTPEALQTFMWNNLGPMHRGCVKMELYIVTSGFTWETMPPEAQFPVWNAVLKRLDDIEARLGELSEAPVGPDPEILDLTSKLKKLFN